MYETGLIIARVRWDNLSEWSAVSGWQVGDRVVVGDAYPVASVLLP